MNNYLKRIIPFSHISRVFKTIGPVSIICHVISAQAGTFTWPVVSPQLPMSNGYSAYNVIGNEKYHTGFDLVSSDGSLDVLSADSGVAHVVPNGTYSNHNHYMGNVILIDHNNGKGPFTLYAHLQAISVTDGQSVTKGQKIGTMGTTGCDQLDDPCGVHLHFETKSWRTIANLDDDAGTDWGYTPGYPNLFGYINPWPYLDLDLPYSPAIRIQSVANQIIRTGPNASDYTQEVTTVTTGQSFVSFSQYGNWHQIYLASEKGPASGWIQANSQQGSIVEVKDPARGLVGVGVRESATTESTRISYAWDKQWFANLAVEPSGNGCDSSWVGVDLGGNAGVSSGWICSDFLTIVDQTPDTIPPTVDAFDVTPRSGITGTDFTISYTVSDSGGAGLNRVELWRANDLGNTPDETSWAEIKRTSVSGDGPLSASMTDAPLPTGAYWYGIHVVDNDGNYNDEQNTETGGLPGDFGPIKVTVTDYPQPDLTLSTGTIDKTTVTAGETINVDLIIKNVGSAPSGSSYVYYYFKDAPRVYSTTYKKGDDYFPSLGINGTSNESFSYPIPADTIPGTYYFYFWIDAPQNVTESDENNNAYYWTITVIGDALPPSVTTDLVYGITETAAAFVGTVTYNEVVTDAYFEYGETTAYGSTTGVWVVGELFEIDPFEFTIVSYDLMCGATYHFRAVAQNAYGIDYGEDLSFETLPCTPTCKLNVVSGVLETSAVRHEACENLILGPDFISTGGSSVTASSGLDIELLPGFLVEAGATFEAKICGQSLCEINGSPMPYGCHSCVSAICDVDSWCCENSFDGTCLSEVDTVCGLVCE